MQLAPTSVKALIRKVRCPFPLRRCGATRADHHAQAKCHEAMGDYDKAMQAMILAKVRFLKNPLCN